MKRFPNHLAAFAVVILSAYQPLVAHAFNSTSEPIPVVRAPVVNPSHPNTPVVPPPHVTPDRPSVPDHSDPAPVVVEPVGSEPQPSADEDVGSSSHSSSSMRSAVSKSCARTHNKEEDEMDRLGKLGVRYVVSGQMDPSLREVLNDFRAELSIKNDFLATTTDDVLVDEFLSQILRHQ